MDYNEAVREILEEMGVEPAKIDEVLAQLPSNPQPEIPANVESQAVEIKKAIAQTQDWRRRASLAARLVSLGIEE